MLLSGSLSSGLWQSAGAIVTLFMWTDEGSEESHHALLTSNKSSMWKFDILRFDAGKMHPIGRSFVSLEYVGRVWRTDNDEQEAKDV